MSLTPTRSSGNAPAACVALLATPFLALFNFGFPIAGVGLRLPEIGVLLVWLALLWPLLGREDGLAIPRRSVSPLWLAAGGYLIVCLLYPLILLHFACRMKTYGGWNPIRLISRCFKIVKSESSAGLRNRFSSK